MRTSNATQGCAIDRIDGAPKADVLDTNMGVVVGLALLLIELDQNSDLVRAQIHQDRSAEWVANRFE